MICPECNAPLGAELDCFAALGLDRKLVIDLPALERAYHDLSRIIHPDRFASTSTQVRDASLRSTALLTRSYRTLRDPVARGLYWLGIVGEKLAENNKQVPPELAALVFEVQEQLAELRMAAQQRGAAVRGLVEEIGARRHELQTSMYQAQQELGENFAGWDRGGAEERKTLTSDLKKTLSRIAYLRTLIRDVDRELESQKAA